MAPSAKKITYTLKAEYEGKGDMKQLSDDLKKLNQIEVLQGVEESFAKTNKDFVEAKAKVRELRKEMRKPGGEAFAESYEKARKEVQKLSTSLQKQKGKLDSTRDSLRQQGVEVGKIAGDYAKMQAAAEKSARVIAARQKLGVRSWKQIESEIKGLERAYKDMEASGEHSMVELAQAKEKLRAKTKKLNAEMGKTDALSRGATGSIRSMVGQFSKFGPLLASVAAGMATLAGAGYLLERMVTPVVENTKALENLSRTAGLSVPEFDAAAYAVGTLGIEQEKLADISKDVKDKIGDFIETGGGEFKDFFENVAGAAGVTAEELIKLSGPDALIAIKKAMDDANVPMESQVFYLEAIANDASLLIPLLKDEGKAFKELARYAKESGIAISDLEYKELIALQKVVKEYKDNLGVLRREIVVALAPAVRDLTETFIANKDQIKALAVGVGNFVSGTTDKILRFMSTLQAFRDVVHQNISIGDYFDLDPGQQRAYGQIRDELAMIKNLEDDIAQARRSVARKERIPFLFDKGDIAEEKSDIAVMEDYVKTLRQRINDETSKSGEGFDNFVNDGKKAFDATADAARDSAGKQKTVTAKALKSMKQEYEKYVDQVKQLQEEISTLTLEVKADRLDFAEEELRLQVDMVGEERGQQMILDQVAEIKRLAAEAGAAGGDGWKQQIELLNRAKGLILSMSTDAKKVSEEEVALARKKVELAKQEVERHNVSSKRSVYKQALEDYQELVKAKNQGPSEEEEQQNVKEKLDKVKEINKEILEIKQKQIEALKNQQDEAAKSMDDLIQKADFQDLAKSMDESKEQWLDNWKRMRAQSIDDLDAIDKKLDQVMKDRTARMYYSVSEQRSGGGAIGTALAMAGGGSVRSALAGMYFPGYGGGDRRHVIAEDGEVMLRKEAVKAGGLRAALAFNAMRFDVVLRELLQRFGQGGMGKRLGGPISLNVPTPSLPPIPQMMAAGGTVIGWGGNGGAAASGGDTFHITVNAAAGSDGRGLARQIMGEIERAKRRSS